MKVVVQNGVSHALSRREIESMIPFFPTAWSDAVDAIVLYQGSTSGVVVTHHPKERIVGHYWPRSPGPHLSKDSAVDELLVALAAIVDLGHLPQNLSKSHHARYLDLTSTIRRECSAVLVAQPSAPGDAPPKGVAPLS